MERYTLDTNCILAIANAEPDAVHVQALVEAYFESRVDLAIPAVAALERQRDDGYLAHFDEFVARLTHLGLGGIPIVQPIAYYGIGFYGHGYLADEPMLELERRIQEVLHPDVDVTLAEYCNARGVELNAAHPPKKWRNARCDVQALWSHIYHERSCFVTNDSNFFKSTKRGRLSSLGARAIRTPEQAVIHLAQFA